MKQQFVLHFVILSSIGVYYISVDGVIYHV